MGYKAKDITKKQNAKSDAQKAKDPVKAKRSGYVIVARIAAIVIALLLLATAVLPALS